MTPKTDRYNREALVKKEDKFKAVHPGDIVYNPMNMTIGSAGFNEMDRSVAVSGYYVTMRMKEGFSNTYFNTWLTSPRTLLFYKIYATGSLVEKQRIQFSTLSAIKTPIPSFDEQKKIGTFFKQLDDVIALHQDKLEKLKLLKQGFLQVLFADQEKTPKVRFANFAGEWEQRKVSSLADKTFGGGTPKTDTSEYWQGKIPWLQSSDLSVDMLFEPSPKKFITDIAVKNSATKIIPSHSIAIVTRVGVGKLAYIPYKYATSQDFLSLSKLKVNPVFCVYSLYRTLRKEANNTQGTSIKGITKSDLLEKKGLIPMNIEEQKKIGLFFKQIDDTITLHQKKLSGLKQLKKSFLQSMFI